MSRIGHVYQDTDIESGDELLIGNNEFAIRRGGLFIHLRWSNLVAYVEWLERNSEHLPPMMRKVASNLHKELPNAGSPNQSR